MKAPRKKGGHKLSKNTLCGKPLFIASCHKGCHRYSDIYFIDMGAETNHKSQMYMNATLLLPTLSNY